MTLPAANNPISLAQLQAEFGGTEPIGIHEYYRGGPYVNSGAIAGASSFQTVPLAPLGPVEIPLPPEPNGYRTIQLSQFYETQATIIGNSGIIEPPTESMSQTDYVDVTLPAGVDLIRLFLVGGGGGGGGRDIGTARAGDGGGGSVISGTISTSQFGSTSVNRTLRFLVGRPGSPGISNASGNSSTRPAARGGHGYPIQGVTNGDAAWSSFINTYGAAWDFGYYPAIEAKSSRMISFATGGSYTFQFVADNEVDIYVDGAIIGSTNGHNDQGYTGGTSFQRSISDPLTRTVNISAGYHKVTFVYSNSIAVGAYACRIVNASGTEIWTTRYDLGSLGTPAGGSGGYPGGSGTSGMGGAGGSGTVLYLIHPYTPTYMYHVAVAGGGGGGGGQGLNSSANRQPNVSMDANWMTQGWGSEPTPELVPGSWGEDPSRPNQFSTSGPSDGAGGGGGGGGIRNYRAFVPAPRDWTYSGAGGRTRRDGGVGSDSDADGGESGKSFISSYPTRYADFQHANTTSRFPNLPSTRSSFNTYGIGGEGASPTASGTAGTIGVAYVDWGVTSANVTAPSLTRSAVRAGIVLYDVNLASSAPSSVIFPNVPEARSCTLDAFGGGGNPGSEYTYTWINLSGPGSLSSANTPRTILTSGGADTSGIVRCTVSDGTSSATADFSWTHPAYQPEPPPETGA